MRTALLTLLAAVPAFATPSSVIWINSVDSQAFGTVHVGVDNFVAARQSASPISADLGLTFGLLPDPLRLEIGADWWANAASPVWLNAKLSLVEDGAIPGIAVGAYGVGIDDASAYHVVYAVAAKTFGPVGRITLGGSYGVGDPLLFGGPALHKRASLLLAWERTLSEISEDLWIAADVQTGTGPFSAVSAGFAYKLGPAASILVGYNHMLSDLPSTVYVALDADLTLFGK